jgi:hypothetical protein
MEDVASYFREENRRYIAADPYLQEELEKARRIERERAERERRALLEFAEDQYPKDSTDGQ